MPGYQVTADTYTNVYSTLNRHIASPLNALPPIKERIRLIVGDMLTACLHYRLSYPYWEEDWRGDVILMSFDPVAHDTVALDVLSSILGGAMGLANRARPWLKSGAEIGLGTDNPDDMELTELTMG